MSALRDRRGGAHLRNAVVLALGVALGIGIGFASPRPAYAASGGGGAIGGGGGGGGRSPQAIVHEIYKGGLRHRDKALDYEKKAAAADTAKARDKMRKRATNSWRKAVREFKKVTRRDRDNFRAFNDLGYARRKLGEYEAALEAYDRALEIEPRFAEAVEYRAEAYLGLARLADAKREYLRLVDDSPKLAAQLLSAMRAWVERPTGAEVPQAERDAFSAWVAERVQQAGQTASADAAGQAWD